MRSAAIWRDVPPGPGLGLVPVGAAEPVQRGRLAADVLGDLVQLVGRHVQTVRLTVASLLRRRVLDDEVLAGRALDGPLDHLDEPAHAVLLVDDVVAGAQLERVDLVAPPRRHPAHVLGPAAARLPGQVGLGDDGEPLLGVDEAPTERAGRHVDEAGRDLLARRVERGGDVMLREDLVHAPGQAVAVGDDDDAPAVGDPGP